MFLDRENRLGRHQAVDRSLLQVRILQAESSTDGLLVVQTITRGIEKFEKHGLADVDNFGGALAQLVKTAVHCISSTRPNSGLVAYGCITQVARNGNLQIEMHSFTSQQLPQR